MGFSEAEPSLENVPDPPEDLIKGTNMSSWSVPVQQHSTYTFAAMARRTRISGQLL